jgi:hypothetical protein
MIRKIVIHTHNSDHPIVYTSDEDCVVHGLNAHEHHYEVVTANDNQMRYDGFPKDMVREFTVITDLPEPVADEPYLPVLPPPLPPEAHPVF